MGCAQTKTKPTSVVIATSTSTPVYVKSVLKNSRINGTGKTERLSVTNGDVPVYNKSVNFDEKVEVKMRTPTPRQIQDDIPSSTFSKRQISNDDDDDDEMDPMASSFSSQEDYNNGRFKTSSESSFPTVKRQNSNTFWHKSNSVAVIPAMNNMNEQYPPPPPLIQQPPVNMTPYPAEDPNLPIGRHFKVRRKIPNSVQRTSPLETSYRSNTQSSSMPVQRPIPNTNAVLVEHGASFSNSGAPPQPAYYAFRRPMPNTTLPEN